MRALRAELYKRSWNDDEIAARALVHTDAPRAASRESPPESPPAAFPSRFTDAWFAQHVPVMDAGSLGELQAVLHGRNWTDEEIAGRVFGHADAGAVAARI